jgi:hypothetical protein
MAEPGLRKIIWIIYFLLSGICRISEFFRFKKPRGEIFMSPRSTRVSNQAMAMEFVGDVPFPVSKRELMRTARANNAPEEVIAILEQVPDRHYENPQDLSETIKTHVKNNFRITAARNTRTIF